MALASSSPYYWPMHNLYLCYHGYFFYVSIVSARGWLRTRGWLMITRQFSFVYQDVYWLFHVVGSLVPIMVWYEDLHSMWPFSYVHLHASAQNSLKLIFHFISLSRPLSSQAIYHGPLFHTYTKLRPHFCLHKVDYQGTIGTSLNGMIFHHHYLFFF